MPGTTPRGYPYPLPTEPVAEGAQAIRNLAEALDAELIGAVTLAAAGPIDFPNIPQTFTHLQLIAYTRTAGAIADTLLARANGNAAAQYNNQRFWAQGATVAGDAQNNVTGFMLGFNPGVDTPGTAVWGLTEALFPNYRAPGFRAFHSRGYSQLGTNPARVFQNGGVCWANELAISRLTLTSDFGSLLAGSRAQLYGVR